MSTIISISLQQGKPRLSNKEALVECEEWTEQSRQQIKPVSRTLHVESMLVVCAVAMVGFMLSLEICILRAVYWSGWAML